MFKLKFDNMIEVRGRSSNESSEFSKGTFTEVSECSISEKI